MRVLPEWTEAHKSAFLKVFAQLGIVTSAATVAEIDRSTVYLWLETDDQFKAAYDDAKQQAIDYLEEVALKRATGFQKKRTKMEPEYEWVDDPHSGKKVKKRTGAMIVTEEETTIEVSDNVLIALLRAGRPDKYRERVDVTRSDVPPVKLVDREMYEGV